MSRLTSTAVEVVMAGREVRMATVAVLGMGLLGRGFAENLLQKGHEVRVWNRTASKCEPVVAQGAVAAGSPAEAVAGAERVHLVLAADAAVDAVIEQLKGALAPGVPVIDHSTNLPAGVAARSERLRAQGVRYVHAPVFMGPSNSRDATGLMLLGGPADEREALLPVLQTMTGRVLELGDRPDEAAAMKIIGNGMLLMLAGAMGDLYRIGRGTGVTPEQVLALFEAFSPSPAAMGRRVLEMRGQPPTFELEMARKDARLMIESAGGPEGLTVLPGIARAMDALLEQGRGHENFTVFAEPLG
jgi:3-hydroxyisobutyrate dehydrogenase